MIIGINASFLRKQNTGIGQVTANFLKKLAEMTDNKLLISNNKLEFILYLEEDVNLELPNNFKKRVFLPKYKRDDLIRKIWWEKIMLPQKISIDKCDILLSLYQSPTVLGRKNDQKIQHLMIVHDIIPEFFPGYLNNWRKKFYWKLVKNGIRNADEIIAVSNRTEKDLIEYLKINSKNITVSYIDVDPIYKKTVSPEENQLVLDKYGLKTGYIYSGGGLEIRKNVEGTIRAYKVLLDQNKNRFDKIKEIPDLVISGKLMPELAPLVTDVEALVESMDIKNKVKILDFVPQSDLPALYKNASMFIYPSFYEGFGMPILEAMNQGVPVITAKTSSLSEVGGDSVLYCDPADIENIAMIARNILIDFDLRQALSEKSKKRGEHFSWDNFVNKIISISKINEVEK